MNRREAVSVRLSSGGRALALAVLASVLAACGGGPGTPAGSTPVAVVPTAAPQGEALALGTLVLTQLNTPLAITTTGQTIRLSDDRFGGQGAPNGRYGVRFTPAGDGLNLELVDYSSAPPTVKAVPDGVGLRGPGVTWRADSAGFAFFDFPPLTTGAPRVGLRGLYFYDVASGQTSKLIPDIADTTKIATSVAFSPDGKYLLYAVGDANAEGVGGPDSQPYLLDLNAGAARLLLPDALIGYTQWLPDSSGFLAVRADLATGNSGVYLHRLATPDEPLRLTPEVISDFLADAAPDSKRVVVTSTGGNDNAPLNIYMVDLDGSGRRAVTAFTAVEQAITGLVWANDGIYYSLSGPSNLDTVWRVGLDGTGATQLAEGTLYNVITAR